MSCHLPTVPLFENFLHGFNPYIQIFHKLQIFISLHDSNPYIQIFLKLQIFISLHGFNSYIQILLKLQIFISLHGFNSYIQILLELHIFISLHDSNPYIQILLELHIFISLYGFNSYIEIFQEIPNITCKPFRRVRIGRAYYAQNNDLHLKVSIEKRLYSNTTSVTESCSGVELQVFVQAYYALICSASTE